jgi:hypothetical protein
LHLFDLLALILNFLLLLLDLRLSLLISVLVVLHLIANRKAAYATKPTADRGTSRRMTDRSAN